MNKTIREINNFYRILGTVCPKYKNIRVTENDLKDENILSEVLYDIEDNVYVYEGAEELYHDIKYYTNKKRYIYNAVKVIGTTLIIIGLFALLGTAGASDLGNISISQILIQILLGVIIFALGLITLNKMEA
jgi:hypothetical protein